ncbi:protein kinase [Shewanella sp. 1CM18E]|uniref:protein kinase domain-containing protein n=1 Tax=Shewanella sp. 1CM18E TaxID=2929169 RepID=UPI0020C0616C|nr:protein kinase [Shewanella sp. 1CM18E]MCK8043305.1 protein kinase [Shewanella sp. 1CM18E]
MKGKLIAARNYLFSFFWYLLYSKKYKRYVHSIGISDLRPTRVKFWNQKAIFFKGVYQKREVFIKCYKNQEKIGREIQLAKVIGSSSNDHLCNLLLHDVSPFGVTLCSSMLNASTLTEFSRKITEDELFYVSKQFYDILIYLRDRKIVHCDIRPDNIMIDNNLNVTLIDFEFSIALSISEFKKHYEYTLERLVNLGGEYKFSSLIWDDAYSFNEILKELSNKSKIDLNLMNAEYVRKIQDMIGEFVYAH